MTLLVTTRLRKSAQWTYFLCNFDSVKSSFGRIAADRWAFRITAERDPGLGEFIPTSNHSRRDERWWRTSVSICARSGLVLFNHWSC